MNAPDWQKEKRNLVTGWVNRKKKTYCKEKRRKQHESYKKKLEDAK